MVVPAAALSCRPQAEREAGDLETLLIAGEMENMRNQQWG